MSVYRLIASFKRDRKGDRKINVCLNKTKIYQKYFRLYRFLEATSAYLLTISQASLKRFILAALWFADRRRLLFLAGHGQAAAADFIEAQERSATGGFVPTQTTQEAGWARSSASCG